LDDVLSRVSGHALTGGSIMVIQTHGRNGQYKPHLHCIATSGGWDQQARPWVHLDSLPYPMLRKKWQWHLLTMLRQTLQSQEINRLVETCSRRYREGFVTNVHKGDVPARDQSLARYRANYVVSPPISLRRMDRYDGPRGTYHDRSPKSERVERETVEVYTFSGRMMQPVFPKGFHRIRYDGVPATNTLTKIKGLSQAALAKVKGIVKGASKIIASLTYRPRYQHSSGRAPLRGPHWQREMDVWRIWHPTYGRIHDELKAIERGQYASQAPRAEPAGSPGRAFWPAAGGIPLPRSGLQ
jgi:putative transposase